MPWSTPARDYAAEGETPYSGYALVQAMRGDGACATAARADVRVAAA